MNKVRIIGYTLLTLAVVGAIYGFVIRFAGVGREDAAHRVLRIPNVLPYDIQYRHYSRFPPWIEKRLDGNRFGFEVFGTERIDMFSYSEESSIYEIHVFSRNERLRSISVKPFWPSESVRDHLKAELTKAFSDFPEPPVIEVQ